MTGLFFRVSISLLSIGAALTSGPGLWDLVPRVPSFLPQTRAPQGSGSQEPPALSCVGQGAAGLVLLVPWLMLSLKPPGASL